MIVQIQNKEIRIEQGFTKDKEFFIEIFYKDKSERFDFYDLEPVDYILPDEVLLEIFLFLLYDAIDAGIYDYEKFCEIYNMDEDSTKAKNKWEYANERLHALKTFVGWSLDDIMSIYDYLVMEKEYLKQGKKLHTNV